MAALCKTRRRARRFGQRCRMEGQECSGKLRSSTIPVRIFSRNILRDFPAKTRAVSDRLWTRSASRFGGERVRKREDKRGGMGWVGSLATLSAVCFGAERMRRARNTQKRALFRTGFGRGLRLALVASGCENERDARKSACLCDRVH